jgi:hypothetical protein
MKVSFLSIKKISIALIGVCTLMSGCSLFSDPFGSDGTKISTLRPKHPGTKTVALDLSRAEYEKALDSGSKNEIRLIQVFSKEGGANAAPEYRFFGIKKGSVYDLMGLQSLDILVAASDYVVPGGDLFWQYLQLLRNHETGSVEIRRDGVPMVFTYSLRGPGMTPAERLATAPGVKNDSEAESKDGGADSGADSGSVSAEERRLEKELSGQIS